MAIKQEVWETYVDIWEEAGYPPVDLITATEFKKKTGDSLRFKIDAICSPLNRIFCVKQNLSHKELRDSIWHEILHCIYPNMPEWWVSCAAYKLSRNNSRHYGYQAETRNKTPKNTMPSRQVLLELVRDSSLEMNKRINY